MAQASPAPSIRLAPEDHLWLAEAAQAADLSADALIVDAVEFFLAWHQKGKPALQVILADLDGLFREHDQEMQSLREHYERRLNAARCRAEPYRPKVAKLLALALSTTSDGEASVAFAKARAISRRLSAGLS
jgi:Protein of unknown function (DUF2786)